MDRKKAICWSCGGNLRAIREAVTRCQAKGYSVARGHVRSLNPFPSNLADVLKRYKKCAPELNMGQLAFLLQAHYVVEVEKLNKVQVDLSKFAKSWKKLKRYSIRTWRKIIMSEVVEEKTLTRKDFVSDQEVRWCPGCGDYAILAQMQKVSPGSRYTSRKYCIRFWYWMFEPFSILHEYVWRSLYSRSCPRDCDRR